MANVSRKELLKELEYVTGLLKKHEATKKEEKLKSFTSQQNCGNLLPQKLNMKHPSHQLIKNSSLTSFGKNYSFKKPNNLDATNRRTVLNKNFKAKYELYENRASKNILIADKGTLKQNILNRDILSIPKKTVLSPQSKSVKISTVSSDKPSGLHSHTQFMEEIKSLTEQLKKKTSENIAKNESNMKNKLSVHTNNDNKYNYSVSNKYGSISSATKSTSLFNCPQKIITGIISSSHNQKLNKNSCTNLNVNNISAHFTKCKPPKHVILNKYSYKKVDKRPVNCKITSISFNTVKNENQPKNIQRHNLGSHIRRVTYSDSRSVPENSCLSSNASVCLFKPLPHDKQNLTIKLNITKGTTVSSIGKLSKESHNATQVKLSPFKIKTPSGLQSSKLSKLKPARNKYIKINKHLTTPNKSVQLTNAHKTSFSAKKIKRNVNTKYKVVNKNLAQCSNKNTLNLRRSGSKENSPIAIDESDSFFQKLNDSTIAELEQNLLAISTALTSTPVTSKTNVSSYKIPQNSRFKVNSTLRCKKIPLKKSKARISKYKVVNSNIPQNYSIKREQNFASLKTGFKKINYSKFSLVNKRLQPGRILTPVNQGRSVLVKRLFKSKNTIINKNASPTSYSAKMIKSKYLTLNKRKSPVWQKHALRIKVPSHHQKFKGYYSKAKPSCLHNRYKTAALAYHPKGVGKFPRYGYPNSSRLFSKNASKYKRKLKSGYTHSPVVFIRGVRYSMNSSGKTLKKLPGKGQTTKSLRRIVAGGKVFRRTPENVKTPTPITSNLASRVLHRSINRILSASTKKSLTKVNTYCMFYNRFGRCNRGVKCTYIHDPSKIAVCTRFLRGTCKIDGCPFSHEIAPGKMAICSFFLVGACDKADCPYRHEKLLPDAVLCKAFVQGYCSNGKECKKAHILICPKYIQGDCDKGNSCAFPHPPKKVKKNVQKEENEGKKPDDVLLENVSRYFLQVESHENNIANQYVPKQRRQLEEQPSFIPLFDSPVV